MATNSTDVFLAILALDSYNRGYSVGIDVSGNDIGHATIGSQDSSKEQRDAGFYAQSYDWAGTTVISYRGTTFSGLPDGADVFNGWSLGLGAFAPSARRRRSG
jgi:hypothetical protein